MKADRCPACRQRIPLPILPVRVCFICKRQIIRHDKWIFDGSRIRHRHCDNPDDYFPLAVRQKYNALKARGLESRASAVLDQAKAVGAKLGVRP